MNVSAFLPSVPCSVAMEYYVNDVVYRFDHRKRLVFGVVVESYESYVEDSEDEKEIALKKGQIKVLWNNSSRVQVWKQSRAPLVNRNIISGDIVRRLEGGKETQRGYCKEVKQVAVVQIVGTNRVIEHVSKERLHPVRPFDVNDAVCLGNKYGRIQIVHQMIIMESSCGSIVKLLSVNNPDLVDYWLARKNRQCLEPLYAGQEITCIPGHLKQAEWIRRTKIMKRNMHMRQRFTIQSVEDVHVEVFWYDSYGEKSVWGAWEIFKEDIKRLTVLEDPADTCLEMNQRRLMKISASDILLRKRDWMRKITALFRSDAPNKVRHVVSFNSKQSSRLPKIHSMSFMKTTNEPLQDDEEDWWTEESEEEDFSSSSQCITIPKLVKKHYPPRSKEMIPGHTLPVEIIYIESRVTVVWQDGTEEKDIPSTQLYYSVSLDDHEFFPGEWVVLADDSLPISLYGVVQNVHFLERTAKVKWFSYTEAMRSPELLRIEEHSVYDLKKHPTFVFRPGSIVRAKSLEPNRMGRVIDSCIEGYVKVLWVDYRAENCWPQNIELIPDRSMSDVSDYESSEEDPGEVSWETESIESYAGDMCDETALQNMAARLDFVRSRVVYMRDTFKQHQITQNFSFVKELLLIYENCSYLDKFLGTSFFSLKSSHFQALLTRVKEIAKASGIELKNRLFTSDNPPLTPSISRLKLAEKENVNRMIKLEGRINAQLGKKEGEEAVPLTPESGFGTDVPFNCQESLEVLTMLKIRMDLAYAEIISRIGDSQALTVLTNTSEDIGTPSTPLPSFPVTPDDSFMILPSLPKPTWKEKVVESEAFAIIDEAPSSHHFFGSKIKPSNPQSFFKAVNKEYALLSQSLPAGLWVRTYGDRADLLSVMIRGPARTPYEDGLFLFDIQLGADYPRTPPVVHYISYSAERLNPNLYVEGKVCISLLGTWMGRGTETWGPNSTLLQLIVSIQGLILVSEPYYNEAGYERLMDTQQGYESSRTYNELVLLNLVQSMRYLLHEPPEVFKKEIILHFVQNGQNLLDRLERYCSDKDPLIPEFSLFPVSKGLKLSMRSALAGFKDTLSNFTEDPSDNSK